MMAPPTVVSQSVTLCGRINKWFLIGFYLQGGSEAQSVPQEEGPARSRLLTCRGPGTRTLHRGLQWGPAAVPACCPIMSPPDWTEGQGQARDGKGETVTQNAVCSD